MDSNRHDKLADALAVRIGAVRRAVPAARTFESPHKAYASLVARYDFARVRLGEVMLLAADEARDWGLTGALARHGYVQIGRPDEANYDPVCLKGEELVQLDHEEILLHARIRVVAVIAEDFPHFAETAPVSLD